MTNLMIMVRMTIFNEVDDEKRITVSDNIKPQA